MPLCPAPASTSKPLGAKNSSRRLRQASPRVPSSSDASPVVCTKGTRNENALNGVGESKTGDARASRLPRSAAGKRTGLFPVRHGGARRHRSAPRTRARSNRRHRLARLHRGPGRKDAGECVQLSGERPLVRRREYRLRQELLRPKCRHAHRTLRRLSGPSSRRRDPLGGLPRTRERAQLIRRNDHHLVLRSRPARGAVQAKIRRGGGRTKPTYPADGGERSKGARSACIARRATANNRY